MYGMVYRYAYIILNVTVYTCAYAYSIYCTQRALYVYYVHLPGISNYYLDHESGRQKNLETYTQP